jgi:putative ABC transport system ATP-binding protein
MLEANAIDVVFNPGSPLENHAIKNLSLTIRTGEFATVIGTNGAGKSTLLGCFAGDVQAAGGKVKVAGQDVTRQGPAQRAKLIGRVFQDPRTGTCEALTILENLAISERRTSRRGLGYSTPRGQIGRWRDRLAELGLGLENRLHDKVGLLSGGQRQSLSLLMACMVPNSALLLDEHTAALDPGAADMVLRLTDTFVERDKLTVLMVTHSMVQALSHGTRTIMLHEGRIILDLSAAERSQLGTRGLLDMFSRVRGQEVDDDSMVLG